MFRIRAVESPPDAGGLRKVWHRGARHAELVSEIDDTGRVARHEFSLFDDVVIWERGRGFVTGSAQLEGSTRGAANVAYDLTTDGERMVRIAAALQPYAGRDRIIQHLRELVVTTKEGGQPLQDLGAVTGSNRIPEAVLRLSSAPPPQSRKGLVWISIGLVVIAIALALMALK
ncbi:MAG: hypothetical protein Q8L48_16475 [Archangium sp.]|nr:hypothetical protein [Archangium sp.]